MVVDWSITTYDPTVLFSYFTNDSVSMDITSMPLPKTPVSNCLMAGFAEESGCYSSQKHLFSRAFAKEGRGLQ